ncbi:MAG: class I SAM-dependent methyltransferase [Methanosarcinaceae archaeon]|nr:class I SAM-dependent methyltransferase [Methanosarcinaceae archaeon]
MGYGNQQYIYPDLKDRITSVLISSKEPYEGYWEESENFILDLIKKHISKDIINKEKSLLDAGCGEGRLTIYFSDYFERILAIDPDRSRLDIAIKETKRLKISNKIDFDSVPIEEINEDEKFDVILCSHVFQHVQTSLIPKIIEKLSILMKKPGLLFVTTCHSTKGDDYFVKNYLDDFNFVEETIDQDSFNSLVFGVNQLPTHLFSRGSIEELLKKSGFKIIDYKVFHIIEEDFGTKQNRDITVNQSPSLQNKYGRDVFIAAKKE